MTKNSIQESFHRLLLWRERHIPEKTFVVILALVVGTLGGFCGVASEMVDLGDSPVCHLGSGDDRR